jgi:endonuclease/exonuclease/phosphatase (EEP) superfamily protein YafD
MVSVLLCGLIAAAYAIRPDALAAATVFPIWAWLVPGGLLAGIGYSWETRRFAFVVLAAWLLTLAVFADAPLALLRFDTAITPGSPAGKERGRVLRVISLNCGGGNIRAVEELAAYQPDLLVLQESPGRTQLEEAAKKLFGDEAAVVWSADASIVARGKLAAQPMSSGLAGNAVRARWVLDKQTELDVVSLRLEPALVRADLWSPDCWQAQTANRRKRLAQLQAIVQEIERRRSQTPLLIGGDFNAPPGDAVFRLLKPLCRDAFAAAGRGWGNTITNDFPFLRIDQIWLGDELTPVDVVAVKTKNSDHRAVVCDLR